MTHEESYPDQTEHNSLFDPVEDEDKLANDELCENCGDDGDVRKTGVPGGIAFLCPECRLAHTSFDDEAGDDEAGDESQGALSTR